MGTRIVKFDFFSVEVPEGVNLWDALDRVLPSTKAVKHGGQPVRIESYSQHLDLRVGTATKIKMEDLPYKASLREPGIASLDLNEDEGVTSPTSFVFAPKYSVLVLQRNPNTCVRAGAFLHLIESLTGLSDIALNIMLEPDAVAKLQRMNVISSFLVRVASPLDKDTYEDEAVTSTARLARYYAARTVKLELGLGAGKHKEGLAARAVRASALRFLKLKTEESVQVENLIIKGKEFDDEKMAPLDLIKQRIVAQVEVPLRGREFSPADLEAAAIRAYNEKEEVIRKYKPL